MLHHCICFLWLNNYALVHQPPYLIGGHSPQLCIDTITDWASAHPKINFYIYYDTPYLWNISAWRKRGRTKSLFKGLRNVSFVSIRTLKVVKSNPTIFNPLYLLYFRIDLLKLIILHHALKKYQYAIFSDFGSPVLPYDQLFNESIHQNLQKFGIIVNNQCGGLENQFIQVSRKARIALAIVININLKRVCVMLASNDAMLFRLYDKVYRDTVNNIALLVAGHRITFSLNNRVLTYNRDDTPACIY